MTTVAQPAFIYGLHCVCGCEDAQIRYIGLTTQRLSTRLTNHRGMSRYGIKTPVYHWMRKHGEAHIRIRELEVTDSQNMDAREIDWIERTPGLLNISPGGEGGVFRGKKRPDISERMTGENHPAALLNEEAVRSMRARYTGKYGELTRFAREFGVRVQTVEDAVKGKSWKHITD